MARIKLGTLVTGVRGTIGGLVFSANKSGCYAKVWAKGSNPKSIAQASQRGIFADYSAQWRDLTPSEQAAWDTFAALPAQEKTDSLGEAYFCSGFNWFVAINTRLELVGRSSSTTPPSGTRPTAPTINSADVYSTGAGTSQITYPAAEFGPTYDLVLFVRLTPSPGRRAVAANLALVAAEQTPSPSPFQFQTELEAVFGDVIADYTATLHVHRQSTEGLRSAGTTSVETVQ